jgi:hypothetical protein
MRWTFIIVWSTVATAVSSRAGERVDEADSATGTGNPPAAKTDQVIRATAIFVRVSHPACDPRRTELAMVRSFGLTTVALLLPLGAAAAQAPAPSTPRPPVTQASRAPRYPAPPPARVDTTASCNDGTYWASAAREGACANHGGIKEWYDITRPINATAKCNDGTFWIDFVRERACMGHRGVREWYQGIRPANATGRCKDDSYWTGARQGACAAHRGLREWYAQPEPAKPN